LITSKSENEKVNSGATNYIFIAILAFILNSAFTTNYNAMLVITGLQVIMLFVFFIKGNDMDYLCFYIIFTAASMEFSEFIGTELFYGFKNFKVMGINIAVWLIIPLFLKHIIKGNIFSLYKKKQSYVKKFTITISLLTVIATIVGLISIMANDNGVGEINGVIGHFFNEGYIFFYSLICILLVVSVIEKYKKETGRIKNSLLGVFIGLQASIIYAIVTGTYGNYGGLNTLRVSNIVMFVPLSLLIPFYLDFKKKTSIVLMITSLITVLLALYYNSNGKLLLLLILVPILIFTLLYRKGRKLEISMFIIILPIVLSLIAVLMMNYGESSRLLTIKIEQTFSFLAIWKQDWLETMNASPRARIAQFLNIGIEYYEKPYFLITGKGYLGSIPDHLNMFVSWSLTGFSSLEWSLGAFYQMHETLNTIFLTNGVLGLILFGYIIKLIVTKCHVSVYLLIGCIWFILFYGYSVTLAVFGIAALIVGLYDLDKFPNQNTQKK